MHFANRLWAWLRRYRGANSYHNSNRMTFMRVPAWRAMLLKPGATAPYLRRGASLVDGSRCQSDTTLQPAGGCLLTLHACSGLQTRRHHGLWYTAPCSGARSRTGCRKGEAASRRCGVTAAASRTVFRLGQLVLRSWPAMWTLLRAMSLRTTMALQDVVPLQCGVHVPRERFVCTSDHGILLQQIRRHCQLPSVQGRVLLGDTINTRKLGRY